MEGPWKGVQLLVMFSFWIWLQAPWMYSVVSIVTALSVILWTHVDTSVKVWERCYQTRSFCTRYPISKTTWRKHGDFRTNRNRTIPWLSPKYLRFSHLCNLLHFYAYQRVLLYWSCLWGFLFGGVFLVFILILWQPRNLGQSKRLSLPVSYFLQIASNLCVCLSCANNPIQNPYSKPPSLSAFIVQEVISLPSKHQGGTAPLADSRWKLFILVDPKPAQLLTRRWRLPGKTSIKGHAWAFLLSPSAPVGPCCSPQGPCMLCGASCF